MLRAQGFDKLTMRRMVIIRADCRISRLTFCQMPRRMAIARGFRPAQRIHDHCPAQQGGSQRVTDVAVTDRTQRRTVPGATDTAARLEPLGTAPYPAMYEGEFALRYG